VPDAGARPHHVHPRLHCRLKFFVNLHEIWYLVSSSAAGSSKVQPKDAKSIKAEAVLKVKDQVRYMVLGKRIQ
jgi:hypothetical protein